MKKIILKSLPILFLVTALAFMMIFHHEDELSDREVDEFETFSNQDHTTDPRVDTEEEFKSVSQGETVIVMDADDEVILETTQDDWEDNKDYYSQKYNLN